MASQIEGLQNAVNALGSNLLLYALALAAVGTIAMGVLEMIKSVTMARMWFNRWRVSMWANTNTVLNELLLLAVGAHTDPNALYDQPAEKMMGQIQAAANLALEYPEKYPHL
jgi:hypothetical protein